MNQRGNVAGDPVNEATDKVVRTRSRFPSLSYHFYNTERFGEYNVPFVMDCVEGDRVPIRSGGTVNSYTLKAPLLQSIFKKKDFYMVPMEAILPKNWQKFYTNPTIGDDVSDDVGTGVKDFWSLVYTLCSNVMSQVHQNFIDATPDEYVICNSMFRGLVIMEYFYSQGSLIKSLGCSGNRFFKFTANNQSYSFDSWFDLVCATFVQTVSRFSYFSDGRYYVVVNDESIEGYRRNATGTVAFRTFLQMMRDDLTSFVNDLPAGIVTSLVSALGPYFDSSVWTPVVANAEIDYDLRRLWAYQLVNSHFYTNDSVDYVYSADLFRSLIDYFVFNTSLGQTIVPNFRINGLSYQYDSMSAKCFSDMVTRFNSGVASILTVSDGTAGTDQYNRNCLGYFSALFAYRRSLRYVDYFTGARTRPLAVGDVNVNVNSNLVNIVDVTRNIQRQRFFNAVNRFGRKFENYIQGLSGIVPDTDYHNPLYLAHVSDTVYGVQVENTGADQLTKDNSITSRFQTNGSRYQFEFEVDRPCVVIGISYYDMPRAYLNATERQLFHMNRFDMFNPFMQFIGDQAVNFAELGCDFPWYINSVFGYQLRHMEYKQRFDQAAGGFIEQLPGWLFSDREFGDLGDLIQNPSFIRSLNAELDNFYVSLTGYSLGHYFHFIVDNDNRCDASRPMAYAPSIL